MRDTISGGPQVEKDLIQAILTKEGIEYEILDWDLGKGYKQFLALAFLEESGNKKGDKHTIRNCYLIDLWAGRVLGNTKGWVFNLDGDVSVRFKSADYSNREGIRVFKYDPTGFDSIPLYTFLWEWNGSKFNPYKRYVYKLIMSIELLLYHKGIDSINWHVRKYIDTYGSYVDEIDSTCVKLESEIEDMLMHYPDKFRDMEVDSILYKEEDLF